MTTLTKIQSKNELKARMNELTEVLSQAFYNDPYYVFIMPDDEKRISQIKWWMRVLLRYSLKNGAIYVTYDYKGIALWLGPDKPTLDNIKLAISGLILFPFKAGLRNFINMVDVSTKWEKEHAKQNKRHYYLLVIGVDPILQRKGIGSQLMEDVLKKADTEKLDCYLETVTTENLLFYQKHDFEIVFNKNFGNDSQYWIMNRKPK